MSPASNRMLRRTVLQAFTIGVFAMTLSRNILAQEHEGGGSAGHGGEEGGGGSSGHGGGEGGGGCSGCGGGGGGSEGHGGEGTGRGNPEAQGRTPAERAVRHRERHGRTLGGGESTGGHTGGGGEGGHGGKNFPGSTGEAQGAGTEPSGILAAPSDGSTTGPIGGAVGGEHFIHRGTGYWGADRVLRGR